MSNKIKKYIKIPSKNRIKLMQILLHFSENMKKLKKSLNNKILDFEGQSPREKSFLGSLNP